MSLVGNRRAFWGVLLFVLGSVLVGCKEEGVVHPDARTAYEALRSAPVEKPLARVNGQELSAEDFEAFRADNPTFTREEAIRAWIEQEVVAQHAASVLGQDDGALAFARKQAMVRVLLGEEVEKKVRLEDEGVAEKLESHRERLQAQMSQPAGVRVSHLVVHVPKERRQEGAQTGTAIPAEERARLFEQAHEWAVKIRAELGETASLDDLYRAEQRYAAELSGGLLLAVNPHLSFAVPPAESEAGKPQPGSIPAGWLEVVREFAVGAAAMVGQEPGSISEPVRSDFGWHLIRFEKAYPAQLADLTEVEARARAEVVRAERARRLGEFSSALIEASHIQLFPQVIGQEGQIHGK